MNHPLGTQSEELLERVAHVPDTPNDAQSAEEMPLVPFPSDLVLTREEEEALVDHAESRLHQIEGEMGRNAVGNESWWQDGENIESGRDSWMGKRELYEATYHNQVDWRPAILGGIFEHSNLVVPLARRICRQMIARANNYFFATDPWFSAKPEAGTGDHMLAEKIDHYARYKLTQSKSKANKESGTELSFIRGEAVMKSVYRKKVDYYNTTASILVDVSGEPMLDSNGGYIYEKERWVPMVLVDEATGEEQVDENNLVLERDSNVRMPSTPIYDTQRIRISTTLFSGAESQPIYFKDFLCPLTAPSVQDADICAHLYDMPFMDLAETYRVREVLSDEEEDRRKGESEWSATVRAVNLLRELSVNDGSPKASKDKVEANSDRNFQEESSDMPDPIVEVAEAYLYFDANGDGIREHIMLVYDRNTKMPIFYDYVANMTPDAERPFSVIRPTAVDGRWYGVGAMEMFDTAQTAADLLTNRMNHSQSTSGRVTFWRPDATFEGDRNPNLKLNDGDTYTLKPGFKPEDALAHITLPDVKQAEVRDMLEFFLQMAMNESGVQHANDANMAGLDQAKLATGIRNIEKSGMEIFGSFISSLEPGLQETLTKEINLILANLDEREVFEYFAADGEAVTRLMEIDPDDVRDISVRVSMMLTRYRGEQTIQQSTAAKDAVIEFYGQHPMIQERVAPFYRMFIKALDISVDAEAIIQPLPLMEPGGGGGADPNQASQAMQTKPQGTPAPNL